MSNREILGELKTCYEYLQDIIDNSEIDQVNNNKKLLISDIQKNLAELYNEIWKKTDDKELYVRIKNKGDFIISEDIIFDYQEQEDEKGVYRLSGSDLEYNWWEENLYINNKEWRD